MSDLFRGGNPLARIHRSSAADRRSDEEPGKPGFRPRRRRAPQRAHL